MGDGVAVLKVQGAVLAGNRAEAAALGAGLLGTQGVGLTLQEGFEGALDETLGGGLGDLLHSIEIEVEGVVAGASGDDLTPLSSEVVEFLQFVGGQLAAWHDASCLEVETITGSDFPSSPYPSRRRCAKLFMTSE